MVGLHPVDVERDARLLILHPFPVFIASDTVNVDFGGRIVGGLRFDLFQTL
jgi:hypothetical protein